MANSGRVIIKLTKVVDEGQVLCNEKLDKVAKVTELIGPVAQPYASAIPLTNNIKKYVGKKIFALASTPANYKKFRRHRK